MKDILEVRQAVCSDSLSQVIRQIGDPRDGLKRSVLISTESSTQWRVFQRGTTLQRWANMLVELTDGYVRALHGSEWRSEDRRAPG